MAGKSDKWRKGTDYKRYRGNDELWANLAESRKERDKNGKSVASSK